MRKLAIVLIPLLILALVLGAVGCDSTSDEGGGGVYIGSVNSNIYHYPSCEWAKRIYPQNEIWFSSVADAKAHGYRACKVCKPPS